MDILTIGILVLLVINLVASVAVIRASVLTANQRFLQLSFVWLFPLLGAIVCLAFTSSQALGSEAKTSFDPLRHPGDGGTPVDGGRGSYGCSGSGDGGGDCGGGGD